MIVCYLPATYPGSDRDIPNSKPFSRDAAVEASRGGSGESRLYIAVWKVCTEFLLEVSIYSRRGIMSGLII